MKGKNISDRVVAIIAESMELEPSTIKMNSNLMSDLELESLDLVDLVVAFEKEFGIEIADQDIKNIQTVGDIVKYAEDHQK